MHIMFASTPRQVVVRWPTTIALLVLLLLPFISTLRPVGSFAPTTPATTPSATLPAPLRASLFAQLGQDDPAAQLHIAADGTIHAPAIAGLETTLDATTLRLGGTQPAWQWTLQQWGREANLTAPAAPAPAALHANQVHFAQGGLDSWYVAGAGRIEQGWTIAERPTGNGPLLLSFSETGSLHGTLTADGRGLELRDAFGFSSLRYAGLLAFDATGRSLVAHFAQRSNGVAIVIDDATATYPLTIDPWVQSATLTVAGSADNDALGTAVALSTDGNTLVVGAPNNAAGGIQRGVVYIYTKPAGGWTSSSAPSATLTAASGGNGDNLGRAVALSADGNTLVAGAPFNAGGGTNRGAVYVYTKPAGGWASTSAPSATLTAASGGDFDRLGWSVALSADGSTLVVGAPYNDTGGSVRGVAYVYTRPAGGWASSNAPAATLTAAGGGNSDRLGTAVALSADGNTLVAGAPYNAAGGIQRGAVYIYTKSAGGWTSSSAPSATLTAATGVNGDNLGWAVALSADGSMLVAGAPFNAAGGIFRGAAYVYTKPAGGWTSSSAPSATLTAASGGDFDNLGTAVALSADGDTLVVGAPGNAAGGIQRGAVYVYRKPAGGWTSSSAPSATLTAAGGGDFDRLGPAVALSADGSTLVTGAPTNAGGGTSRGATYLYTKAVGGWASTSAPDATLTAAGGGDNDNLGSAVALSADGNTLVVGALNNAAGGIQRGAAYVYTKPAGGWTSSSAPSATLTAAGSGDGDNLGWSVALSADGSTLVAGAPFNAAGGLYRGAVYVYTKPAGGWASSSAPAATLTAASGGNSDRLGSAVALSADGSILVVGALYNAAGGTARGAAYVYTKPAGGWASTSAPSATLTAAGGGDNDNLGRVVALSADGSMLVAGAPGNAAGGTARGAAYVYTKPAGGWTSSSAPAATLTAAGGGDGDNLGRSVMMSADGSTLVAGAPFNAAGGTARGAAYVYTKPAGGWASSNAPAATLTAASGANSDNLGWSLALSADGSTLVAGAPNNATGGTFRGIAYVYRKLPGGWASTSAPATKLTADPITSADGDRLGSAVALSADGSTTIVGAPNNAGGGTNRGAAYVFTLNTNANLSGLALSQGALMPAFAADTTSYTATVANSVSSLTVTPTIAGSGATVTVNGTTVAAGSASGPITLNVGPNTITVLVTAQDSSTKSYTITVTRAASSGYTIMLPLIVN